MLLLQQGPIPALQTQQLVSELSNSLVSHQQCEKQMLVKYINTVLYRGASLTDDTVSREEPCAVYEGHCAVDMAASEGLVVEEGENFEFNECKSDSYCEDGEKGIIFSTFIGNASGHIFSLGHDNAYCAYPTLYKYHNVDITAMDVNCANNVLVTAENNGVNSRVVVWDLITFTVLSTISDRHGVKLIDISENGTLLLMVSADLASTVTMYEIPSGKMVLNPFTMNDSISAACFTGAAICTFAITCAQQGVVFFLKEEGDAARAEGLMHFDRQQGDYDTVGAPAFDAAITGLCRFEGVDELVAGTEKGQLLVWHGRTVAQLIEAHRTPVTALDFNRTSGTLISGAGDGVINVYTVVEHELALLRSFDMGCHASLRSHNIAALNLSPDGRRALVTTDASEALEIAVVALSADIEAGDPVHAGLIMWPEAYKNICTIEPSSSATLCQTGEEAAYFVEQLVQFNTKMLFDSALPGCGQAHMYSSNPHVVLVNCPLCEARGRTMYFDVQDGCFSELQDHVNKHYTEKAMFGFSKRVSLDCSVLQFNIAQAKKGRGKGRFLSFELNEDLREQVDYSEPPPYPVGDWWDVGCGMYDSATNTLYYNNDLALKLSTDTHTLYEFAAWCEAHFPKVWPPQLPVLSKYDPPGVPRWEIASMINFNVHWGETVRRFKLFKKAFKGERNLTMQDECGTVYSRESAPLHNLNVFNEFHKHYLMATKHKVNIKDILSARYRSDWIKNVRTIYKNAKSTAGSAAGWSPTTYSTMLEATKKIQYYLHKNFPLESIAQDALTDTGESVNSVENENLPPHVNTTDGVEPPSLKGLSLHAQQDAATVPAEVAERAEDDPLMVLAKQLGERMKRFARDHADKNNIVFKNTKMFYYRVVVSQCKISVSVDHLRVMMDRFGKVNERKGDAATIQTISSKLLELEY